MAQQEPPLQPPWTSRGYLPHFDVAGIWQAITYRLADSMPANAVAALEREFAMSTNREQGNEQRKRIDRWIDRGYGSCLLYREEVAALVFETWYRFAGIRYDLGPWVIMPNHVHVLIRVNPGWPLKTIVASWKSYTSKRIMRMTGRPTPIWWPDYWDRFIRDERHWLTAKHYIENNPVAAGLAVAPSRWRWGSAHGAGTREL